MKNPRSTHALLAALLLLTGCGDPQSNSSAPAEQEKPPASAPSAPDGETVRRLVAAEEAVLEITPLVQSLARALVRGHRRDLPDPMRAPAPVSSRPASSVPDALAAELGALPLALPVQEVSWPVEPTETAAELPPWGSLRQTILSWSDARFGVLRAQIDQDDASLLVTDLKFEGRGVGPRREPCAVKAEQQVTWKRTAPGEWSVADWQQHSLAVKRTARPFFEEVLESALPDGIALEKARRSLQEERTADALQHARLRVEKQEYADLADLENTYQFPAVSVVDYDGDGRDDLFVTARWSPPQLLRNRGDGTFEDVTARSGLSVENCVNCALFADFDNDGDPDALLGRSLEPARYFVNDGGRFRDATRELTDLGDQHFVSAASAADLNRDGLLDVYLSTYSPGDDVQPVWKERYLPADERARLESFAGFHPYFDDRGIANIVLMNRGGGRLERATPEAAKLWRKSYQAAWADVDNDGDDDLYVCNDFAPDSFLRNDTPAGAAQPVFTEAMAEHFPGASMAFGMGASFADYDRDGDLDLYVSNMYSKAGNRIIAQVGKVDPRIVVAARGNFLYRNEGGTFRDVAVEAHAAKVGWAFGGQFADFNNDGRLDLYVPSGLYTAPQRVATQVDL